MRKSPRRGCSRSITAATAAQPATMDLLVALMSTTSGASVPSRPLSSWLLGRSIRSTRVGSDPWFQGGTCWGQAGAAPRVRNSEAKVVELEDAGCQVWETYTPRAKKYCGGSGRLSRVVW